MKKIFTLLFLMALVCVKGWGQTASATWALTSTTTGATATPTGNVAPSAFTYGTNGGSDFKFNGYSSSGASFSGGAITGGGSNSAWYQFAVAPASGNKFTVSTFSFTGQTDNNSGGTISVSARYLISSSGTGLDNDFYNKSTSIDIGNYSIKNDNSKDLSASLNILVPNGSTLYIRLYPANGKSANTHFYTRNAVISGTTAPTPTISSFTPPSACYGSGTSVTINGSNLSTTSAVTFNGTNATFSNVTATSVTAILPSGATTGPISVTTSGGIATSADNITVNPNSFITYQSGSGSPTAQTPCANTAITNIVYTTSGGTTGISASGLPDGVNAVYNAGTVTVSGKPTASGPFNYSITTTGGGCTQQTVTGTITVRANAFISYQSGDTATQSVCAGTGISNITYQTSGSATGVDTTGLPNGLTTTYNSANGIFTIQGTPNNSGTFHYKVTTRGGSCSQQTLTGTITVRANATIQLTSATGTDAQNICSAGNTTITPITYQWGGTATGFTLSGTLPTGVTGTANGSTYTISGTTTQTGAFNYTVTATGNTCTNKSLNGTITINQTPTATISGPASAVCASPGGQVTFTGTAGATVSYTRNGTAQTPVNLPSGSGSQSVGIPTPTDANTYIYKITRIITSASTCTGSIDAPNQTVTVTVHANPAASITIASSQGTGYVQIGNTISYTGAPTGGTWSSDNTAIATAGQNLGTVTGIGSGTANITYTTPQDGNGCTGTATNPIIVTADYITKQAGNFSSGSTWQEGTTSGYIVDNSIPQSTNTIEVDHALTLDQNFTVGANKTVNFNIGTNGTMVILPNVTFSSQGTVDFGNNPVVVQSTTGGTGSIGQMATEIAGATNVTVERYIPETPTNGSLGRTGRAWRLLTAPITDATTTIYQAWQESKNNVSGLGTLITGEGVQSAVSPYFDYVTTGGHHTSIKQYNPSTGNWDVITGNDAAGAGTNIAVSSQPAWMLFIRGDRDANTPTTVSDTKLRATGTLRQGVTPITVSVLAANAYTLVGNPFASPIDFEQIYSPGGVDNTSIQPHFYTWNSKNGVFGSYLTVTRNAQNSYTVVPTPFNVDQNTASNAQFIQSGEGFFVQPNGGNGTLTIGESAKGASAAAGINPYRISASTEGRLLINLNLAVAGSDTTSVLADGVMARFDKSYSAAIDGDDIRKQTNFNENLGIENATSEFTIEARPEVEKTDTLQLKLWNTSYRSYQLQLKGDNFAQAALQKGLHAYLEDSYLKTRVEISLSGSVTTVPFTIINDAGSYNSHRFRVVFQAEGSSVLPITLTQVKAALQNSGVSVSWTTQNEVNVKQYVVERSNDGGTTFSAIADQKAKNNGATTPLASYQTFDAAPHKGDNFYRIRVEGVDGKVTYSGVVKVTTGEDAGGKTLITLYPNPVSRREGKAWLSLQNVKSGDYLMSVYSESGQNIVEKKITVAAGSRAQTESVPLPQQLAQGSYQLQLTNSNGTKVFTSKFIVGK